MAIFAIYREYHKSDGIVTLTETVGRVFPLACPLILHSARPILAARSSREVDYIGQVVTKLLATAPPIAGRTASTRRRSRRPRPRVERWGDGADTADLLLSKRVKLTSTTCGGRVTSVSLREIGGFIAISSTALAWRRSIGTTGCQRRREHASARRSKNTSMRLAEGPRTGGLFIRGQAWVDGPPTYPSWGGVSGACSD
jgi:hypothetical protein